MCEDRSRCGAYQDNGLKLAKLRGRLVMYVMQFCVYEVAMGLKPEDDALLLGRTGAESVSVIARCPETISERFPRGFNTRIGQPDSEF